MLGRSPPTQLSKRTAQPTKPTPEGVVPRLHMCFYLAQWNDLLWSDGLCASSLTTCSGRQTSATETVSKRPRGLSKRCPSLVQAYQFPIQAYDFPTFCLWESCPSTRTKRPYYIIFLKRRTLKKENRRWARGQLPPVAPASPSVPQCCATPAAETTF